MMTTQEALAAVHENSEADRTLDLQFYDAAEATRNDLFDAEQIPTDEQLRTMPIDAVLRYYAETQDAEALVAVELALADRDGELREYLLDALNKAAELEILAEGWAEYAKRKAQDAKAYATRAARITGLVRDYMLRTGEARMDIGPLRVVCKPNNPAVVVSDVALLPEEYTRTKTTVEADKVAIKAALKAGLVIDGAELTQTYRIEIK
jgi:hypothetical protein